MVSAVTIGQLQNITKTNPVEYLTPSVCFVQWSITKCDQSQQSIIANTECLFQ